MDHAITILNPAHKSAAGMKNCISLVPSCSPPLSRTSDLLDLLRVSKVSFGELKLACFQMRCDTALNLIDASCFIFIHNLVKLRNPNYIIHIKAAAASPQIYRKRASW